MEHLITSMVNWLTAHWGEVGALVAGAAGLSVGLETFLNTAKVKSKALAYTLIHLLGILTAVATYFLSSLPTTDVPAIYGALVILAQTWHRFVISPAYNRFIVPYLTYVAGQKTATAPVVTTQPEQQPVPAQLPETEASFETTP